MKLIKNLKDEGLTVGDAYMAEALWRYANIFEFIFSYKL